MRAAERIFVDTNVLLYSVDKSDAGKQKAAWEWLDVLWRTAAGRLSWQVLNEFYANATRKMAVEQAAARRVVASYAQWQPVGMSMALLESGWQWMDKAQVSFWDSLIVAAAERAGCAFLLSEDFQHGRRFGDIAVVNPFQASPLSLL